MSVSSVTLSFSVFHMFKMIISHLLTSTKYKTTLYDLYLHNLMSLAYLRSFLLVCQTFYLNLSLNLSSLSASILYAHSLYFYLLCVSLLLPRPPPSVNVYFTRFNGATLCP